MTEAKAQTLASALIAAGCSIKVQVDNSGNWTIAASRPGNPTTAAQLAGFATAYSVNANVDLTHFS